VHLQAGKAFKTIQDFGEYPPQPSPLYVISFMASDLAVYIAFFRDLSPLKNIIRTSGTKISDSFG
jgi:hypothetical protein